MYESPQKKNSSWTPSTVQKKGKSPSKLGHFSIQPKPNPSSESSQEIGEYSRTSMDRLAANVMRSLQTREQEIAEESIQPKFESPWAPTFEPPPPLPESPASKLKGAFAPVSKNPIQRQCAECAKEEEELKPVMQRQIDPRVQMREMIQRAHQIDGNQASGDLESRLNASKGGGSPLSENVKGFMEPRFGADFSGVRVHTGGEAVQMNQELGAQAFTHGSDVYFGQGKEPGNNELTAHELTHVVQQTGSATDRSIQRKPPKPASKDVKTECQGGECHSLIVDDGGKGKILQPEVVLNPTGKSSHDLFKELFTPSDQLDGLPIMSLSELIQDLVRPTIKDQVQAAVLANAKSFDDFLILRGSLPDIINGLNTLEQGVNDTSLDDVFLKKNEIPGVPDERSLVKARINALRILCEAQKDNPNTATDAKASDRQRLLAIAMSQVGTVFGDVAEAVQPDAPEEGQVRVGYQRIAEYLATAFGDPSYLDPSSYKHKQVKHKIANQDTNDVLLEWCGIFVLWAFKSAGFRVGVWEYSTSIPHIAGFKRVRETDVKPGDVGMVNDHSHQFIVVRINSDGNTLTTVEGNTNSSGSPVGGKVFMHSSKRAISTTDFGFFRADDLDTSS